MLDVDRIGNDAEICRESVFNLHSTGNCGPTLVFSFSNYCSLELPSTSLRSGFWLIPSGLGEPGCGFYGVFRHQAVFDEYATLLIAKITC